MSKVSGVQCVMINLDSKKRMWFVNQWGSTELKGRVNCFHFVFVFVIVVVVVFIVNV